MGVSVRRRANPAARTRATGHASISATKPVNVIQTNRRDRLPDLGAVPDSLQGTQRDGAGADASMPEELSPRHLRARLIQLGGLIVAVVLIILLVPGLGQVRHRLDHASAPWVVIGGAMEVLSTLSYVLVFRSVFCQRMSWRLSYQIGMAEQAANSLLPAGGAGGLALGAWALRRGGVSADHIARRTVAFFLLTSLANLGVLIVFGLAFALGIFRHDGAPALTFGFTVAAVLAILVTLALPTLTERHARGRDPLPPDAGRIRTALRATLDALGSGVRDAVVLLRRRVGVSVGSLGYMGFDIATLAACFAAFGHTPPFGVLVIAYIIGQLGGLLPIPGGIGGVEGGLIGTFALYHVPIATATVAVLTYRALALWIPAVLGTIAFVQLRRTLRNENEPAAVCGPLAEPLELAQLPSSAAVNR